MGGEDPEAPNPDAPNAEKKKTKKKKKKKKKEEPTEDGGDDLAGFEDEEGVYANTGTLVSPEDDFGFGQPEKAKKKSKKSKKSKKREADGGEDPAAAKKDG